EPGPVPAVGGQEDYRGGPVPVRQVGAAGEETAAGALEHRDVVAGPPRQAGGGGERPHPAIVAGPDRIGADGGPGASAPRDEAGRVPRRRRAAARGGHPAQAPGPPAVKRDEELGPGHELTGFGANR